MNPPGNPHLPAFVREELARYRETPATGDLDTLDLDPIEAADLCLPDVDLSEGGEE